MAGLDTRGAFDGFVQGFNMVEGYNQRKEAGARADQQAAMQERGLDMREQEFGTQQEEREKADLVERNTAYWQRSAAEGKWAEPDETLLKGWEKHAYLAPAYYQNEKTGAALARADRLAAGEGSLWDQGSVQAMDHLFSPWIGRGKGGKKRLAGVFPGQQEGALVFELGVTPEGGLDGIQQSEYRAPMTAGRGIAGEDDEVLQMPIERVVQQATAMKLLHGVASKMPPFPYGQSMSEADLAYARARGMLPPEQERWEMVEGPDGSLFKVNQYGEPEKLLDRRKQAPQAKDHRSALEKTADRISRETGVPFMDALDQAQKMSGKAGGTTMQASIQKLEDADIEAAAGTFTMNSELGRIAGQLDSGALDLGPVQNKLNAARNWAGSSSKESRNYASMMATMEKLRNESLRLNAGVQTDGDAQRAWNELLTNINDPQLVRQRLQEIKALNERAFEIRQSKVDQRRANAGAPGLDLRALVGPGADGQPQQGAAGLQSGGAAAPRREAAPVRVSSQAELQSLPPGTLYTAPDGSVRRKS